jgi:hypothetical protein
VIASLSGVRYLRKMIAEQGFRAVRLGQSEYYYN